MPHLTVQLQEQEQHVICFTGQAAVTQDVLPSLTPAIGDSWDCRLEFSTQIKPSVLISLFDASLPFHILLSPETAFMPPLPPPSCAHFESALSGEVG